jgi:hypothetical protein
MPFSAAATEACSESDDEPIQYEALMIPIDAPQGMTGVGAADILACGATGVLARRLGAPSKEALG